MNSLDSRLISYGDSFVQIFSQPGSYRYGFGLPTLNQRDRADRPFTIHVKEVRDQPQEEGKQHAVLVRLECGRLIADRPELEVEVGDGVLWSSGEHATPGFSISGYSDTHSFNSAAMNSESVYIHTFGSAGEFRWKDVNGHGPSGTVEVTLPETRPGCQSPMSSEAIVVLISGSKVEPTHVKIGVNKAVLFAVEQAGEIGITITDERLSSETPPLGGR